MKSRATWLLNSGFRVLPRDSTRLRELVYLPNTQEKRHCIHVPLEEHRIRPGIFPAARAFARAERASPRAESVQFQLRVLRVRVERQTGAEGAAPHAGGIRRGTARRARR